MQLQVLNYDHIGKNYSLHRQPDPRIAQAIVAALGNSQKIVNVGAGTGSYEPTNRVVVAVEPSTEMIKQRKINSVEVVCAKAENLPFADNTFDAALAILTVHHWFDWEAGLREMQRVVRDKVVILTWDPTHEGFWLVQDYFPDILDCDRGIFAIIPAAFERVLGKIDVQKVPIPHDCLDGFLGAYWHRPSAYLDPQVRAAISAFSRINNVASRCDRLRSDIESGHWAAKNADILNLQELDIGYRLLVHRV